MTDDAGRFTSANRIMQDSRRRIAYLILHEGKTIHQFSDRWDTPPRYAIAISRLEDKPRSVEAAQYFRAACREVSRSSDERTAIAAMLPPGVLCGHTISVERRPAERPNASALSLVALMNSFTFDWLLRQKAAAHVSLYILADLPAPQFTPDADRFLAHATLRLCCNHHGFLPLWREQLAGAAQPAAWPVIAVQQDRWRLRATMDAVVAAAYGLNAADYQRILHSFSHKSFPAAPVVCLAAFDELASTGLAAFCRMYDPYCDIPLVAAHAQPAIILDVGRRTQRSLLQATAP